MSTNISFGNYTSPPPPKGTIDIRIGVFFDGTQNNRTNTNSRLGKEGEKGNKAFNKMSDGDSDSYMNDLSNVARKELWYTKDKYTESVYIEGIGTDDFGEDSDNKLNHLGVAFGAGSQGIVKKVEKGCQLIADKVALLCGKDNVNTITLDVFGFSRGAAAARYFVYLMSLKKSKIKLGSQQSPGFQNQNNPLNTGALEIEIAAWGALGSELNKKNKKVTLVKVRFVGLYDTVSSYDPNATNTTTSPNYDNDVAELNLNTISHAKKIVHFCADDEHRKNFMLTRTRTTGGKDYYLPGVHSDVGGCYVDKMNETDVQIMDLDNTWGDGYSDKEYDEILNNDLNNLIEQGWFKKNEVVRPNSWHETHINRKEIHNTYSYVTLHLMAENINKEYNNEIVDMSSLNKFYMIPKKGILDLQKVKERLSAYIKGEQPKMKYYTNKEIEEYRKKQKAKQITTTAFNRMVEDHNILLVLRNKYIHWNSSFGAISGAYLPNFTITGKTIIRSRKKEPNS